MGPVFEEFAVEAGGVVVRDDLRGGFEFDVVVRGGGGGFVVPY